MKVEDYPKQQRGANVGCAVVAFIGGCALAAIALYIFG